MSLAVQPAGALGSTQSQLRSSEESLVTLTVLTSTDIYTFPSSPTYGQSGALSLVQIVEVLWLVELYYAGDKVYAKPTHNNTHKMHPLHWWGIL